MAILKAIGSALIALYPILVFLSIFVFHLPLRLLGLFLLVLASAQFSLNRRSGGIKGKALALLLSVAALFALFTGKDYALKFYPACISAILLLTFSLSFSKEGSIIFSFATFADPTILHSSHASFIKKYCKCVCAAWCAFFVLNMTFSLVSATKLSDKAWALYNGAISYVLIGVMFALEFLVRKVFMKRISKPVFISSLSGKSHEDGMIITYSGAFQDGTYKTFSDLRRETSAIRTLIKNSGKRKVLLHADDFWLFIVSFIASLEEGMPTHVSSNVSENFLSEILEDDMLYLSENGGKGVGIAETIKSYKGETLPWRKIDPKSLVLLYTSGSTGKPKAIEHYLIELEDDNDALGGYWRGDYQRRVSLSSVNPHHAFGIVFSVIKPLIYGIPIKRERVMHPGELASLEKGKYLFLTSPSFLLASSEDMEKGDVKPGVDFKIIAAGSPLKREGAEKAEEIFGSFPLEIYGSTETGALAWRVNRDDESSWWTPNHSVKARTDEDGCLIASADGIHADEICTNDIVRMREDGKWLLFGRRDSIVKIAEKRISLSEVESRLMASNLVKDASVVLLSSGRRSFLGAAVALSDKGLEKTLSMSHFEKAKLFRAMLSGYLEGVTIPRKWRFVPTVPRNAMGKLQKDEVLKLFEKEENDGGV